MGETFSTNTADTPDAPEPAPQFGKGLQGLTPEQQAQMAGQGEDAAPATKIGGTTFAHTTPEEREAAQPEPDKFEGKSREEILAAYRELESKLGGNQTAEESSEQNAEQAGTPKPEKDMGIPEAPQAAENTSILDSLQEAYAQTGEISPELRAEFTKKTGLPDSLIDSHLASVQAVEQANLSAAEQIAGGPEAYAEMVNWASQKLSEQEKMAYNEAVYSDNPAMARMAIEGLKTRFERENGGLQPNLIAGGRPDYAGVQAFQSEYEWQQARRSEQYKVDPAFRAQVEARLKRSMELGLL